MDSPLAETARLVSLVSRYLRDDLRPEIEGRHAFLSLVAANLLDGLVRDLETGGEAAQARKIGLVHLLGREGSEAELTEELCSRIAEGAFDETTPGLLNHLLKTTMGRLEIDQPNYAAYRRERAFETDS